MPDASYLITAYLIVLTVFSLWVNSRSQTVWDALRADGALYAAAGRPSDMYFVFDIYRLCYRYAFFLKKHPARPSQLACSDGDYRAVCRLAVFLLYLNFAHGAVIIGIFLYFQLFR
ncbi:hypothetical protein ACLD9W_01610 [Neisseria sp. WLZKY-1]|uniref:hypothetical protein n=1 Tax=Neisseria sp. WLZKY-1 TaxID=3390377 RepID=UPI0039790864